jgi:diguanylate cyclase
VSEFASVATVVVEHLLATTTLGCWLVTAFDGARQHVVAAADGSFGFAPGSSWAAEEAICVRMLAGEGPAAAPDINAVTTYAEAPFAHRLGVAAYVGAPIVASNDAVFGTLCGLSDVPQPRSIGDGAAVVEVFASALGAVLRAEARAETAETDATVDALTGLANRRAWNAQLELEEARCARYGEPAYVISIDLDGLKAINDVAGHLAGDAVLRMSATAVVEGCRAGDFVARLGGDEFGVLAPNCDPEAGHTLLHRVRRQLKAAGVAASAGGAGRNSTGGVAAAWVHADAEMYRYKNPMAFAHTAGQARCRVLVVDDVEDVRQLARLALDYDGRFEVVGEAASGEEALLLAESLRPDAVVLDLWMPGMGGLEALDRLRRLAGDDLAIVVLSALDRSLVADAVAAQGAAFLPKTEVSALPRHLASFSFDRGDSEQTELSDSP